jgi:hypothetical protein
VSYIKKSSRSIARGPQQPVGGLWDVVTAITKSPIDLLWGSGSCKPSDTLTKYRANMSALESSWKPTGLYTWNDLADMTAAVLQLTSQASSMAVSFFAGSSTPDAKSRVRAAAAKYNAVAEQAIGYTTTWQAAKAQGVPISAPGFRQWVVDILNAALVLMRTVELEVCQSPWWVATLAVIGEFFNNVIEVAKRIAGVLQKVGEAVIKAVERTGGLLAFLTSYGPYLAIGGGALYLWSKTRK